MNREEWLERQENIKIIEAGDYTHAVTFNTNMKFTMKKTAELVHIFERKLAKKMPGQLKWIHFFEYKSGNAHIHSAVQLTEEQRIILGKHGRHIWGKLMRCNEATGGIYIDTYKDAVATYISKDGAMVYTTA